MNDVDKSASVELGSFRHSVGTDDGAFDPSGEFPQSRAELCLWERALRGCTLAPIPVGNNCGPVSSPSRIDRSVRGVRSLSRSFHGVQIGLHETIENYVENLRKRKGTCCESTTSFNAVFEQTIWVRWERRVQTVEMTEGRQRPRGSRKFAISTNAVSDCSLRDAGENQQAAVKENNPASRVPSAYAKRIERVGRTRIYNKKETPRGTTYRGFASHPVSPPTSLLSPIWGLRVFDRIDRAAPPIRTMIPRPYRHGRREETSWPGRKTKRQRGALRKRQAESRYVDTRPTLNSPDSTMARAGTNRKRKRERRAGLGGLESRGSAVLTHAIRDS
uniref:Uncharacterized protein n=1 Tax=Vespula pensylvanica TaxID=30213 RepID=A0A834NY97_VESPE|nr:hypothetical protein H0235_009196 [Vespula pensylvanica]